MINARLHGADIGGNVMPTVATLGTNVIGDLMFATRTLQVMSRTQVLDNHFGQY